MTNYMKTVVYTGLQNIKNNDVSDWLKKESTRLVARSLAREARKLQSIDELFLATKRQILSDDSKFKCVGITTENDNSAKIETKLQRLLLELTKKDKLHRSVYDVIRPTCSKTKNVWMTENLQKEHTTSPDSLYDWFCST